MLNEAVEKLAEGLYTPNYGGALAPSPDRSVRLNDGLSFAMSGNWLGLRIDSSAKSTLSAGLGVTSLLE